MKKITTLLSFMLLAAISLNVQAADYKLDQSRIDAIFSEAEEISSIAAYDLTPFYGLPETAEIAADKDPVIALVLAGVVGYLGIHRLYLGTDIVTFIVYLLTGGGCGILALGDFIFLLLAVLDERDFQQYVDNPKILMWKNDVSETM